MVKWLKCGFIHIHTEKCSQITDYFFSFSWKFFAIDYRLSRVSFTDGYIFSLKYEKLEASLILQYCLAHFFLCFVEIFLFSLLVFASRCAVFRVFPRVCVRFSPSKIHTRNLIIVSIRKFSSVVSTHHVFPPSWQIFSRSLAHALSCNLTNWLAARSFSGRIFLAAVSSSSAVHVVVVVTGGKEKFSYPEIFLTFSHIFPRLIESNNLSCHDPNSFRHTR